MAYGCSASGGYRISSLKPAETKFARPDFKIKTHSKKGWGGDISSGRAVA
jgi:hypothetical protein